MLIKISEDVEKLFYKVLDNTAIPSWIEFKLLCDNSQKDLYKIGKLNDVYENITGGLNFYIIVNEEIFEELPKNLQDLALQEILGGVHVSDTDKVSYVKADFATYSGLLSKYGADEMIILKESIQSLFDKKKEREADEKASKKKK